MGDIVAFLLPVVLVIRVPGCWGVVCATVGTVRIKNKVSLKCYVSDWIYDTIYEFLKFQIYNMYFTCKHSLEHKEQPHQ